MKIMNYIDISPTQSSDIFIKNEEDICQHMKN
jgi:hypothetical protein